MEDRPKVTPPPVLTERDAMMGVKLSAGSQLGSVARQQEVDCQRRKQGLCVYPSFLISVTPNPDRSRWEPSAPTLRFGRLRARVPGVPRYGSKAAVPAEPGGAVWSSVADKYTAKCAVHVVYGEWGGKNGPVGIREMGVG